MTLNFEKILQAWKATKVSTLARFGRPWPLFRIAAWTLLYFFAILHWTSVMMPSGPRSIQNEFVRLRDTRPDIEMFSERILTQEGPVNLFPPPAPNLFRIGLIGASESLNRLDRDLYAHSSFASSMLEHIPGDSSVEPVIRDFTYPGMPVALRYYYANEASSIECDLVIFHFNLISLDNFLELPKGDLELVSPASLFSNSVATSVPEVSPVLRAFSEPATRVNYLVAEGFPSFEERFAHTLAPVLHPSSVVMFDSSLENDRLRAFMFEMVRSVVHVAIGRMTERMKEPDEILARFDYLAEPITRKGIPVFFVMTPLDRAEVEPEDLKRFDAIGASLTALDASGKNELLRVWSGYALTQFTPSEFRDPLHFRDFERYSKLVLEQMYQRKLVPEDWILTDENKTF